MALRRGSRQHRRSALRVHRRSLGKVGVVAAIASTEGAVAAVLSAFAGEPISGVIAVTLALIATGIVLASLRADGRRG